MPSKSLLTGLFALLSLAGSASAQVQYKLYPIGGSSMATPVDLPNAGGVINVGTLAEDKELHIYDSVGINDSLGPIVIQGSSVGGTLRVKIVNQSDTLAFSGLPTVFIQEGLRNFAGIRFEHPTDPSDTSLRDNSRVAVAVQGDITGDIEAGEIWRIDALQSADGAFGGTISGNITSFGNPTFSLYQVRYVRAGREIAANILATFKGIERVIAGPLPVGRRDRSRHL